MARWERIIVFTRERLDVSCEFGSLSFEEGLSQRLVRDCSLDLDAVMDFHSDVYNFFRIKNAHG